MPGRFSCLRRKARSRRPRASWPDAGSGRWPLPTPECRATIRMRKRRRGWIPAFHRPAARTHCRGRGLRRFHRRADAGPRAYRAASAAAPTPSPRSGRIRKTTPTMPYDFGDIVVVSFPFAGQATSRKRLAVAVSSRAYNASKPDIVVMAVTSQLRASALLGEVCLQDWQAAGLIKPSAIMPSRPSNRPWFCGNSPVWQRATPLP